MAEIRRYVLVTREDVELDYEYEFAHEAQEDARRQDCAVIARVYEYADSELVWTPDGTDTWPPKKKGRGCPGGSSSAPLPMCEVWPPACSLVPALPSADSDLVVPARGGLPDDGADLPGSCAPDPGE